MSTEFDKRPKRANRMACGCYRYCEDCMESEPRDEDIVDFSRRLAGYLGEGWGELEQWEAAELTSLPW